MATKTSKRILWLTQLALLTAITIVLQMLPIKIGVFQFALALTPVIIGAAALGVGAGGWLGAVFGAVVLLNGDAAPFLAVTIPGTILTVMLKGICAGLAAGAVYRLLEKKNSTGAALTAAATAPIVNTGVFLLCCCAFFLPILRVWADGQVLTSYIFVGFIGLNFVVEFTINLLLGGVIVRVLKALKSRRA
ncbi:MAG: ECF transporter S component [Oscillospiraceae bacterium]|jgi:uncharacterized membrane protein|nr:ECF transporter S component [Oscillospiraceae bacterium]